jgi:hypothetical protein
MSNADKDLVLKVMLEHPNIVPTYIAVRLGWIHANGRPMVWRVDAALVELALDRCVAKVEGKWRVVSIT